MQKQRKKREPREVEQWTAVSAISASLAKISRQKYQYIALLRQISDITGHDYLEPEDPWSTDQFEFTNAASIQGFIMTWLQTFVEELETYRKDRDKAIEALRSVDMLDDDALKSSAQHLTKSETTLDKLEHTMVKWAKIVRYDKKSNQTLIQHTEKWLTRWLRQWQKITNVFQERIKQFQEALPHFQNGS